MGQRDRDRLVLLNKAQKKLMKKLARERVVPMIPIIVHTDVGTPYVHRSPPQRGRKAAAVRLRRWFRHGSGCTQFAYLARRFWWEFLYTALSDFRLTLTRRLKVHRKRYAASAFASKR